MKKEFLDLKSKSVLRAICWQLKIDHVTKASKSNIINRLDVFSYEVLLFAYNETHYGMNRKRIEDALKVYPSDPGAKINLDNINKKGH